MVEVRGVLVKVAGNVRDVEGTVRNRLGVAAGATVEPILSIPAAPAAGVGLTVPIASTWYRVSLPVADTGAAWDGVHAMLAPGGAFAIGAGMGVQAAEPDLAQQWDDPRLPKGPAPISADPAAACRFDDQDGGGGRARGPGPGWNLGPGYSGLADARARVGDKLADILIAHLDTGYDPGHVTLPARLRRDLQRNFVAGGQPDDATDQAPVDAPLANRGHGTGTLGLLAGNKLDGHSPNWGGYADYLGGAPLAQVVPVRIADWVVRFTTGTMVQGIDYARDKGMHVLSMSMGGFASLALADAVNLAYEAGVVLVTAAGNNYAATPSPKSIVFPARFRRVLAACGVMADGRAYAGLEPLTMQGNYGPDGKMDTAIGAFTPNVSWAQIGCGNVVDMDGAGTSAATPQVAAAAALWLAEHWQVVSRLPEPWMRVEVCRRALFASARKLTSHMDQDETRQKIGQGVMQAMAALDQAPLSAEEVRALKTPPDSAIRGWASVFTGGVFGVNSQPAPRAAMLDLELTQLAQQVPELEQAIGDADQPPEDVPPAVRNRCLEAALDSGQASQALTVELTRMLGRMPAATPRAPAAAASSVRRVPRRPSPPDRRLRVYALDPSIAKTLDSLPVNETVLSVPWDDHPISREPLRRGPVGEYLEVVDVDPASNRVYDPVDLNDKLLLAQDGWAPSEGNPMFHQQMVYAVGMSTIRHFEQALGRKALWSPRYATVVDEDGEERTKGYEVRRLRIYPHAFRAANAYYSPDKKALLFGYFPAGSTHADATAPGSMVFACLSSDIVAHEMSHALLDGLHRRFQEASNPDVPAFHEAFADIVALFQHFEIPELVRFEIGRARGNLSVATLLGGLAAQFGEGSSRGGPLRNYLDPAMKALRYSDAREPHTRGSILVFAVYEAFMAIVARRSADLVRLASNGTGVLPEGALHPDLVNRLAMETTKTARQVLHMCIRALDYAPAVDITFGDFLRALVTADVDLVPKDTYGYRVAFMEAFRKRGILPDDVRTISEESLSWDTLDEPQPAWLAEVLADLDLGWNEDLDRSRAFELNEKNRWIVWRHLRKVFQRDPSWYGRLGLRPEVPRYDRAGAVAKSAPPGQTTFEVFGIRPTRRIGPDGSFRTDVVATIHQRQRVPLTEGGDGAFFWFRSGATLVIDPRPGHQAIRYSIVKSGNSEPRKARQRETATNAVGSPLQRLYFGADVSEPFAIMHASERESDHG